MVGGLGIAMGLEGEEGVDQGVQSEESEVERLDLRRWRRGLSCIGTGETHVGVVLHYKLSVPAFAGSPGGVMGGDDCPASTVEFSSTDTQLLLVDRGRVITVEDP